MSGFKVMTTLSELVRKGKGGGGVEERQSKDAYRKEKDLEEDRKLGLAPATVDVDTGRDINPHIPHFITQTPWYVPTEGATLKHQRPHWERQQNPDSEVGDWYNRGVQEGPKANKFRKGACENCGAMTHKKKDCFERPRSLGAKITGDDIAADEFIQPKLKLGFDAKRDRWNGYNSAAYTEIIKEHEKQEEVRKMIKSEKMKEEQAAAEKAAADAAAEEGAEAAEKNEEEEEKEAEKPKNFDVDDEDKYAEEAELPTSIDMDSRTRITVRNLRIREDTAKYLYNLNESAPYYDPKSRSMRENPLAGVKGKEQQAAKFAGENFIRYTGEVAAANQAQVFAWTARCQGIDVHALGEPTKLEQLQKDFKSETKDVKEETKKKLLETYGGAEHLAAPPKELLLAQTESYVEYSRKGVILKGAERPIIRSRYEEDVFPNNHTTIFGSYWANGRWGFKCCHSCVKNSYCIGEQGFAVNDEMAALPKVAAHATAAKKEEPCESLLEKQPEKMEEDDEEETVKKEASASSSSSSDEDDVVEVNSEEEREKKKRTIEEQAKEESRRQERADNKRKRRAEKRKRRTEKLGRRKRKRHDSSSEEEKKGSDDSSDSDDDTEDAKLQKQVEKTLKQEKKARKEAKKDERSRKYNKNYEIQAPTELEMEAFKKVQVHSSDPMAKFFEEKRARGE